MLIVLKTASKRARQTTAEATGDLIGNKIADKITSISKSPKKLHSKTYQNEINKMKTPKGRCISPEKKTANYWWIKISI